MRIKKKTKKDQKGRVNAEKASLKTKKGIKKFKVMWKGMEWKFTLKKRRRKED